MTLSLLALGACSGGSQYRASVPQAAPGSNSLMAARLTQAQKTANRKKRHSREETRRDGIRDTLLAGYASAQLAAEKERKKHHASAAEQRLAEQVAAGRRSGQTQALRQALSGTGTGALVLYDTAGPYGFLGQLYAAGISNLAGHFGSVKAEPISAYTSGQINSYAALFYAGSTYSGATTDFPAAFYTDIAVTTKPVVWMGDNIWNYANAIGPAAFEAQYGWDATNSYFTGGATSVSYKSESLTRTFPAGTDQGVIAADICAVSGGCAATGPAVTTLASAVTSTSTSFPWAVRSGNLTYIGEVPFAYVTESDRIIALHDLMFDALAPATATRHRALVRLEDLDAGDDPNDLINAANYLSSQGVPFSMAVIPQYVDPQGVDSGTGVPTYLSLSQAPAAWLAAIKYALTKGGTLVDHGYTHQYSSGGGPTGPAGAYVPGSAVNNPYDGITADDAEFFTASVNSSNSVIWNGPIPGDSTAWAQARVNAALAEFAAVRLPAPQMWDTPHYFGTDHDYQAIATRIPARYERSLYFNGVLSGGSANYTQYIGQFFPYKVTDIYGTTVIPENLGDYEPDAENNNPPRLPAQIIQNAQDNLAVRDGVASFFYHPYYGTAPLTQIVSGIKALGYTFVSASSL